MHGFEWQQLLQLKIIRLYLLWLESYLNGNENVIVGASLAKIAIILLDCIQSKDTTGSSIFTIRPLQRSWHQIRLIQLLMLHIRLECTNQTRWLRISWIKSKKLIERITWKWLHLLNYGLDQPSVHTLIRS